MSKEKNSIWGFPMATAFTHPGEAQRGNILPDKDTAMMQPPLCGDF